MFVEMSHCSTISYLMTSAAAAEVKKIHLPFFLKSPTFQSISP
ncbi:unnamed protein product [Arabidopsis halleri]